MFQICYAYWLQDSYNVKFEIDLKEVKDLSMQISGKRNKLNTLVTYSNDNKAQGGRSTSDELREEAGQTLDDL